jgi:Lar family restriction alleviation protein
MSDLKPCPFCGEDAYDDKPTFRVFGGRTGHEWAIACSKCEAASPGEDDLELAIRAWNTRALPAVQPSPRRATGPIDPEAGFATTGAEARWIEDVDAGVYDVQPDAAAREAALREALIGLLADIQDYQRINNLGGENNHWQVIARALIDKPGKEVMPDETNDPRHTQPDTAPAGLSAGGGAGWQPIETAPKDGTWFVICLPGKRYEVGRFYPAKWTDYVPSEIDGLFRQQERVIHEWGEFNNFHRATHWMPLPAPPATEGGA